MTISDEISIIANKLANQGKTPSVALIKSKLSQPTQLPQIIAILKTWQHEPDFIAPPQAEPSVSEPVDTNYNHDELTKMIAHAVAPLETELREIKTLLQQLIAEK